MSRAVQHMCVCVLETHNGDDFTRTDFIGVTVLNETNEGWKSGIDDGNEQCNIIRFTLVMLAKHKKGDESPQFKIKCRVGEGHFECHGIKKNDGCVFMLSLPFSAPSRQALSCLPLQRHSICLFSTTSTIDVYQEGRFGRTKS